MISVITPFHNCPELLPDYEAAVFGAQILVIDTASDADTSDKLRAMVERLGMTASTSATKRTSNMPAPTIKGWK
jgi:hypothetical protein